MEVPIFPVIPLATANAARTVFRRSNFYLVTGDQANHLFEGLNLEDLGGRLRLTPRTLAMFYLVTIFQYIEALPDYLAAEALRERIDWKYALHLPMNYPGLEAVSLCDFRRRLLVEQTNQQLLQLLLVRLSEVIDFTEEENLTLEPSQMVSEVCQISQLARTWNLLSQALIALETRHPAWLHSLKLPNWYERYGSQQKNIILRTNKLKRHALTYMVGADGFYLLKVVLESGMSGLAEMPEVATLRQAWQDQYTQVEGKVMWRREACWSCSLSNVSSHSYVVDKQDNLKMGLVDQIQLPALKSSNEQTSNKE